MLRYSDKRTITGRINCVDSFNPQMLPKDSNIRKQIVSRYNGGTIAVFDYKSFETRLSMYLSRDEEFILSNMNSDLHYNTAKAMFGDIEITKNSGSIYSIDKNFNVTNCALKLSYITGSILISLLLVSDPYLDIYKFQDESTRGAKSVLDQTNQTSKGASWIYATQWSFHPKEMISFIYPYFFGLQNTQDLEKGAYWGYMSFTQSTIRRKTSR